MKENFGESETPGPSVVVEANGQSEPDPECVEPSRSESSPVEQHVL